MLPPVVRDLVAMGPIGYVLLGAPVVALAAGVAALVARGPVGRVACAAAASAFGVAVVGAWAAVHGARGRFVEEVLHPDRASPAWPSLILARGVVAEHVGAGTALFLVPFVAAAVAVTWSRGAPATARAGARRGRPRDGPRAAGLDRRRRVVRDERRAALGVVGGLRRGVPLRRGDGVDGGRRLGATVGPRGGRGDGLSWSWGSSRCAGGAGPGGCARSGVALGLAGAGAYAGTRGLAEDAARPLPFEEPEGWMGGRSGRAPRGARRVRSGRRHPHRRVAGRADLGRRLGDEGRGRRGWGAVALSGCGATPGPSFDGAVIVAAPADLPASQALALVSEGARDRVPARLRRRREARPSRELTDARVHHAASAALQRAPRRGGGG